MRVRGGGPGGGDNGGSGSAGDGGGVCRDHFDCLDEVGLKVTGLIGLVDERCV